ncbi:MAG: flagellar hook-associated protein FlgL [Actinobacteria bacterium]|nr:flagellar hook-associated protein FlgL [Actinomycetota bacterium]
MSAIGYTPRILSSTMIQDITAQQGSIGTLEEQLSTGYKINQPSDNPAEAANILRLQSVYARTQQYSANAADALGWLSTGNSTMNQINQILQQIHQLMLSVSSADLAGQQGALNGIAAEISNDRQALVSLANTQYNGQAIFAGTGTTGPAYGPNGSYYGGGNAPTRTVATGVQVSISVTGPALFGTGATSLLSNNAATNGGVLGVLAQTVADLQAGNVNAVETTDLSNLNTSISQVESQAAILGANYQRAQEFQTQAQNVQSAIDQELSSVQDVNLPKAITNLKSMENTYQSALWALSQSILPSLAQYVG